jgi:hypothetical protein
MAKRTAAQPRSLSQEVALQPALYRGGMYLELQKFQDTKKARQLLLHEGYSDHSLEVEAEAFGLNLTEAEDRALSAIQKLLDATGYKGNRPGRDGYFAQYKAQGYVPKLAFTPAEYYEAFGLKKEEDGRFSSHQTELAMKALNSLAKPRRHGFKRKKSGEDGKPRYDYIVTDQPLLSILRGYQDLTEEEASEVEAGGHLPGRTRKMIIESGWLLVDTIQSFYLLKPAHLHDEIKALRGPGRTPRHISLFCEWLMTWKKPNVTIQEDELAERLHLNSLINQRKPKRLRQVIDEACETAMRLNFLLDWRRDDVIGKVLTFTLNPERRMRIGGAE